MEDLAADFIIENNEPLELEAEITEPEHFDCVFELYAAGTTWGSISGTLSNQTDLQQALDLKADKSDVESVTGALNDSITALDSVVSSNYTTLDNKIDSVSGALSDSITALDSIVSTKANTTYVDSITGGLSDSITALDSVVSSNFTTLSDSISGIDSIISNYGDIVTYNAADFATSIQGALADTAVQPSDLATVAFSGDYTDLINKPSIPTVNDGQLTIQVNGSNLATFTANQGTDTIANISIPNAAAWGNITGTLSDQTDLQTALDAKVTNNATGTKALALGNTSQSTAEGGVAVGYGARANSTYATAIGEEARANNTNTTVIGKAAKATEARAIAIGSGAEANAQDAIAIKGINNTANTFQVYTYNLLDMSNGLIPDARISANIARTVDIPSLTNYVTTNTAQTISQTKAFSQPLVIADNNGLASGTILSNKKILQRSSGDNTLTLNNKDNKLRLVGSETRPQYSADGTNYSELALYSDVTAIDDLIPSAATVSNQLADKDFVNSSIATNTANFIGTFNSVAELEAYSGTLTNNDYAFVVGTDAEGNTVYDRYKYTDATTPPSWIFEYELNNSSFTADQWAAINSLITADTKVTHTANTAIGNSTTPIYVDASGNATALSYTIATSVPVGAVFTDTTYTFSTGSANGTIAVSVNGGAATDISVYGLGSAAYTSSGDYATAAQGTKADSAIQSVKVNGSALTPDANQAVDVTVPTNISAFTNDSGYLQNTADMIDITHSLTINGSSALSSDCINIGYLSSASNPSATAIGVSSSASGATSLALGYGATATASSAIQLGFGTNSTASSLAVGFNNTTYQLLDGTTGLIPDARISTNIARTSDIPTALSDLTVSAGSNITISGDTISATDTTYSDFTGADSVTAGASGLVPAPSAGDEDKILTGGGSWESVTTALGYTPVNKAGDTMTGNLTVQGDGYMTGLLLKSTDYDITTIPNENKYSPYVNFTDENGVFTGAVYTRKDTSGGNRLILDVHNSSGTAANLYVAINDNGTITTYCPSPAENSDNTNIANTNWVNNNLYYRAGDTVTDLSDYIVSGYLTSSKTVLHFSIPLPKSMAKVNGVTINTLVISARQGSGGYVPSDGWNAKSNSTVAASFNNNMLHITCTSSSAFSSFTNNISVNVAFGSFKCTFS